MQTFLDWVIKSDEVSEYQQNHIENILVLNINNDGELTENGARSLIEDYLYILFMFFDDQRLFVELKFNNKNEHFYGVLNLGTYTFKTGLYTTRYIALIKTFHHAFTLLHKYEKLTTKNNESPDT